MEKNDKFIVEKEDEKKRIDIFLNEKFKNFSRSYIKYMILNGQLKVGEIKVKSPSYRIKLNEIINFQITERPVQSLNPYNFKLNIIFEDDDVIVINKPFGISMHPGPGNYNNTIVNALIAIGNKQLSNLGDGLRPGIVHRLDKDTSGLIVIAKNNFSHENLSKQFSEHSISRVYLTLVWGKLRPQNGKIETFITRSSKNRQMMEVSTKKGKKAVTNYKTLEVFENEKSPTFSLIECKLETGRTHQIRVHLSSRGNNILGDKKYRKKFKNFKNIEPDLEESILRLDRQFLHAKVLGFNHPANGKRLEFQTKLPPDLEIVLKNLRNSNK